MTRDWRQSVLQAFERVEKCSTISSATYWFLRTQQPFPAAEFGHTFPIHSCTNRLDCLDPQSPHTFHLKHDCQEFWHSIETVRRWIGHTWIIRYSCIMWVSHFSPSHLGILFFRLSYDISQWLANTDTGVPFCKGRILLISTVLRIWIKFLLDESCESPLKNCCDCTIGGVIYGSSWLADTLPAIADAAGITGCLPSIVSNRLCWEPRRDSDSPLIPFVSLIALLVEADGVDRLAPSAPLSCAYGCSAGRTLSYACDGERTRAYGELQSSAWLIELCCETLIGFLLFVVAKR